MIRAAYAEAYGVWMNGLRSFVSLYYQPKPWWYISRSHCTTSQSLDDTFPGLVIPTGHIMTFNNRERKEHKSMDKNRGYLTTGVFFFSLLFIIVDKYLPNNW